MSPTSVFSTCSLFIRRETRELQAAQLLALGVRMSGENSKRMRVLEALGLLKLQSNAVRLTDGGAR